MDSGEVRILGMDPKKDRTKVFEKVGVQFQEPKYQDQIKVNELCENTSVLYRNSRDYKELLGKFELSDKKRLSLRNYPVANDNVCLLFLH